MIAQANIKTEGSARSEGGRKAPARGGGSGAVRRCRRAGICLGAVLFSLTPSFASEPELSSSLNSIQKLCSGTNADFFNIPPAYEHLISNGWIQVLESEDPPAMMQTMIAMTYETDWVEGISQSLAKIDYYDKSIRDNDGSGESTWTHFSQGGTQLTVQFPTIGDLWCAVVGDDFVAAAMASVELQEIDVLPIRRNHPVELQKEPTRRLYQGEMDGRYTVFFSVVDLAALLEELKATKVMPESIPHFVDAIPTMSALYLPTYVLND